MQRIGAFECLDLAQGVKNEVQTNKSSDDIVLLSCTQGHL